MQIQINSCVSCVVILLKDTKKKRAAFALHPTYHMDVIGIMLR